MSPIEKTEEETHVSELFFSERFNTPTGWMRVFTDERQRLRAAEWEDKSERLLRLLRLHYGAEGFRLVEAPGASRARLAIEAYFDGQLDAIESIRTETRGTQFQRQVWSALRAIPVGTTLSYGQLAAKIGRAAAVRAVGTANGANPIPIVVPCHRVIGADASLTGFGGGLERKRWLLTHERSAAPGAQLSIPTLSASCMAC
jgi:methylated-DNA-[protein]-cysteine S-methyltransferase